VAETISAIADGNRARIVERFPAGRLAGQHTLRDADTDAEGMGNRSIIQERVKAGLSTDTQTFEHIVQLIPGLVRHVALTLGLPSETIVQVGLESLRRELSR
jgi:hypothetical protein